MAHIQQKRSSGRVHSVRATVQQKWSSRRVHSVGAAVDPKVAAGFIINRIFNTLQQLLLQEPLLRPTLEHCSVSIQYLSNATLCRTQVALLCVNTDSRMPTTPTDNTSCPTSQHHKHLSGRHYGPLQTPTERLFVPVEDWLTTTPTVTQRTVLSVPVSVDPKWYTSNTRSPAYHYHWSSVSVDPFGPRLCQSKVVDQVHLRC